MPKASFNAPTAAQVLSELPADYEAAMHQLERLVAQMEAGDMPLDQLLVAYQRGAALLRVCREKLQAVEEQIKVLDNGVLKPWKNT